MTENNHIHDEQLEKMLLSLAENEEEESGMKPPVINTFRLRMEAERRRNRRQIQTAAIAAWLSVTATIVILAYFALVLLPETEKVFSPQTKLFTAQIRQSLASYGGIFAALGIAALIGYLISAVLFIAKKDILFTKEY